MFSTPEFNYAALLCWALFLTFILGSIIALACILISKTISKRSWKYAILLSAQLSSIPIFISVLFYVQPFEMAAGAMAEKSAISAGLQLAPPSTESLQEPIHINQSGDQNTIPTPVEFVAPKEPIEPRSTLPNIAPSTFNVSITLLRNFIQNHSTALSLLWLSGVIVFMLRWVLATFGLVRLRKSAHPASPELFALLTKAKKNLYPKNIALLESFKITTPMVISWIKPVILIPGGFLSHLSHEHVETLLIHEVAHIKRHDFFWNVLQRVSETIFFFNPLIWVLGKEIRQLREELCDQTVLSHTSSPAPYAQALLSLAESPIHDLALTAKSSHGSALVRRFRNLLNPTEQRDFISPRNTLLELILLLILTFSCFFPIAAGISNDLKAKSLPEFVEHNTPTGRILDPSGKPIAGARVILHYETEGFSPTSRTVEETSSAADGSYSFKSLLKFTEQGVKAWEDDYVIFATHPDWAADYRFLVPPKIFGDTSNPNPEKLNLILQKPVTQDFTVKLFGKGEPTPLKGAKVYLYCLYAPADSPESQTSKWFTIGEDIGLSSGITDENGKCTLTNLPPNKCGFIITHPDTSRSWKTRTYDQKNDWVTKCFPKASISGKLTDTLGNPIANTTIHAKSSETWPGWYATTDSQGNYTFPNLYGKGHNAYRGGGGDAEFEFMLHHSDWMLTRKYSHSLSPAGETKGFNLIASKGIPFHLTVTNQADGNPYPFASVKIYNGANRDHKFTDSKGKVTFKVIPGDLNCEVLPDESSYWLSEDNHTNTALLTKLITSAHKSLDEEIKVNPGPVKTISGELVLSPDQLPFKGKITLYPNTKARKIYTFGNQSISYSSELLSQDKDRVPFSFEHIPADMSYYALVRTDDGKLAGSILIHPDTENPTIRLEPTQPQKLILFGSDNKPLVKEQIYWGEYDSENSRKHDQIASQTDQKGEIILPSLRENTTYYINKKNARGHDRLETFQLTPDKELSIDFFDFIPIKIINQEGIAIPIKKPLELFQIIGKSGRRGEDLEREGSFLINTKGDFSLDQSIVQNWLSERPEKIEASFITQKGEIIVCSAKPELPITFHLDETYSQIRVESLEKTPDDQANSFRALLVNQDNKPIPNARYSLRDDFTATFHLHKEYENLADYQKQRTDQDKREMTGDDGVIRIDPFANPPPYIRIDAPGYATRWITHDELIKQPIKITLINNTSCSGQILQPDGSPAAHCPVSFVTSRGTTLSSYGQAFRKLTPLNVNTLTDENGRFDTLLEPGNWSIQASVSDTHVINQRFTINNGQKLVLKPELSPASQLTFHLKDTSSKLAVPEIHGNLNQYTAPSYVSYLFSKPLLSDADGSITIKGLIPETYRIALDLDQRYKTGASIGYVSAYFANMQDDHYRNDGDPRNLEIDLKPGLNQTTILLGKGTPVSGKVTTDVGETDLSQIVINYVSESDRSQLNFDGIQCDKEGNFSGFIPDIVGQSLRLVAFQHLNSDKKTLAPTFSDLFFGDKGGSYTFNLHLTQGGAITGRMVDTSGKPIYGAFVSIERVDGKAEPSGLAWAETDEKGNFTFNGIAPGQISYYIQKNNETLFSVSDGSITVTEGRTTDLAEIEAKHTITPR